MVYRSSFKVGLLAVVVIGTAADAREPASTCYDLKVSARAIEQLSTEMSDQTECLCMACPWVLQLKVCHILEGNETSKRLTALSVQHVAKHFRRGIWWLRMNDDGSYNVARQAEGEKVDVNELTRCSKDAGLASAYLRSGG